MLKINFQVNEEYLARQMISTNNMPTTFANYLWDKYRNSYQTLHKDVGSNNIDMNIIIELQKQDFFIQALKSANDNCTRIKDNWDNNQERILNFLNQTLKIDLNLEVTGFIFPPNFNTGVNIGNNCFVWGHMQGLKDENYDLVYLVHEALHSFFDKDNMNHAIIEKISDVELARFLNGTIEHYPYHSFTKEEHIRIYPYWNLYLNKTKEEILKDQEYTKIKYDIDKYEIERDFVSKLDINQLIDFLKEKIKSIQFETSYKIL